MKNRIILVADNLFFCIKILSVMYVRPRGLHSTSSDGKTWVSRFLQLYFRILTLFWGMTPCSMKNIYGSFGVRCWLHLQEQLSCLCPPFLYILHRLSKVPYSPMLRNMAAVSSQTLVNFSQWTRRHIQENSIFQMIGWLVHTELEQMWKEAVVASFKRL